MSSLIICTKWDKKQSHLSQSPVFTAYPLLFFVSKRWSWTNIDYDDLGATPIAGY